MKRFFCFFCVILFTGINTFSQVTIGTDENPEEGTILQLKEKNGVVGGGANSSRGMILPRVGITNLNTLENINPQDTDRPDPVDHEGLVVYNVNEDLCTQATPIRKGVHVWSNGGWTNLQHVDTGSLAQYYTDQDGNSFRAREFGDAGTWMVENLRVTKLANNLGGTPLNNEGTTGSHTATFAYAYPAMNQSYFNANSSIGFLYDWMAATNNKSVTTGLGEIVNGVEVSKHKEGIHLQGICPEGWHLPTIAEWIELEKEIIKKSAVYSSETNLSEPTGGLDPNDPFAGKYTNDRGTHGYAMQTPCNIPGVSTASKATGNVIYDGGIAIMPVGIVYESGFGTYGRSAYFYTSTVSSSGSTSPVAISFSQSTNNISITKRNVSSTHNWGYLAVRCKKN